MVLAHCLLKTCDESPLNKGSNTFSDGVVQRREMMIRIPSGPDEEVVHDWRRFYAKIDGHAGKRDRKGQFSEILRWARRFDVNRSGRFSGDESKRVQQVLWYSDSPLVRIYKRPSALKADAA